MSETTIIGKLSAWEPAAAKTLWELIGKESVALKYKAR